MAKSTLNPREFVQRSFSPFVAVLSSPLVDEVCLKNNLTFIELLEPFSIINKEITYRDPSGTNIYLKNLKICTYDINAKPPEAAIARKLLNESVSSVAEEKVDHTTIVSGNLTVDIPTIIPWFEKWRETFLKVQFPSDHEFTKHYLACMIVITSQEDNPMDTLSNMVQQLQQSLSTSPPKIIPKWFSSSILRYYVLLHDVVVGDLEKAEKVYEEMKSTYSTQCCHMLQINSQPLGNRVIIPDYWHKNDTENNTTNDVYNDLGLTDSFSMGSDPSKIEMGQEINEHPKSDVINHPLSPQLENQRNSNNVLVKRENELDLIETQEKCGACLTAEDVEQIKTLVSDFVIGALIPYVETQMQYLNEMVANKKGVGKQFFNVTKRWFGGPKPGSPVSVPNAHYYHPDSPELQLRRLGDLCFMFGAYTCAFQAYHSAKREFNSASAWLYYAGALEMAALSAFLIGLDIKKAQEYTEESVLTYLHTCRTPQFATRLTLCATECLKDLSMFGEAAGRLLLMTSEDSDLRSALLLEEASYCFIKSKKPFMPRKYAFHLVLAGHRFAKAGQKKHSLRCYRQAYQVYQNKNWSLAEDHIHFTIGKLASSLKQKEVTAAEFSKLFINPSTQLPAQQSAFLKEYFLSLIVRITKEGNGDMPFLQIPHIDHSSIKVTLNVSECTETFEDSIIACKKISEEEQSDIRWRKMEESLLSFANNNSLPLFFKSTISVLSNSTNNSVKPLCVIEERIRTSVDLVNILNVPLLLQNVELIWVHSLASDDTSLDKSTLAETEVFNSILLAPDASTPISLDIIPKRAGDLKITGIKYTVVLQPSNEGADNIIITGYTNLNPRGMRVVSKEPEPKYAPDHRLDLIVVDNAPCLKIYFKNLPSEIFCGELHAVQIKLRNIGSLPINKILFTSTQPSLFSVPKCKAGSNIFELLSEPITPNECREVTIFLRGGDKSGRTSIDLLFYYESNESSHQKLKYRLIYHTMQFLVHESLRASVLVTRSIVLDKNDNEVVNIRLQVQNKNQLSDPLIGAILLRQVSLYTSCWQLYDVISSSNDVSVSLEAEQVVFITLKAVRINHNDKYSDIVLNDEKNISSMDKPYCDFTESIATKLFQSNRSQNKENDVDESAVTINSLLILFWKGEVKRNNEIYTIHGQHHVPLFKFGKKYTSIESDYLNDTKPSTVVPFVPVPPIPNVYYNCPISKELLLVRMDHPSIVHHNFSTNRMCTVSVDLIVQNCCDYNVEVKLDSTYQTPNNVTKVNESALFLWLGVVLHTFVLENHSCLKIPLHVCVGNSGTYDLGSQLVISARKFNSENIFVAQSSVPHSLLCVSNNVL